MKPINVNSKVLRTSVFFVPTLGLTYLNNPKAACTSVKRAMWQQHDRIAGQKTIADDESPHSVKDGPWCDPLDCDRGKQLTASTTFTIVRQPHTRLLSAYLNKRNNNPHTGFVKWCHRHIGGVPDTFAEFVRRIVHVPEQERDRHIRPQWINILWPYVRFDFVGRVEDMDATVRFLAGHGVALKRSSNVTNAAAKLAEHCDADTQALIDDGYEDDVRLWRGELPPAEKTTLTDLF